MGEDQFLTTQWTLILGHNKDDTDSAEKALILLCENYHYPVYAFIRNRCGDPEKARDLTQGFFEFLISKKIHRSADRERGRFRTFLLAAVKNYLNKDSRDSNTLKRGGQEQNIPLDLIEMENQYQAGLSTNAPPDALFDHQWAMTIFDTVWAILEKEYLQLGQTDRFKALQSYITNPADCPPFSEIAVKLGTTEGAIKAAVFRLKARFRDLFRQAVSQVVDHPADVDEEIRYLIKASLAGTNG